MPDHRVLQELAELGLPAGDWALFGSGPLLARGWIQEVGDLDVLARGPAWEHARQLGAVVRLDAYDIDIVEIGGHITIGTSWAIGDFSSDELIDTAELIAGVPCVQLEHVIAYKSIAGRAKDLDHLAIIDREVRR